MVFHYLRPPNLFQYVRHSLQKWLQNTSLKCFPVRICCIDKVALEDRILIGSKRGLFLIERGFLFRIYAGKVYGVTFDDSKIYFYEDLNTHGRILCLRLNAELCRIGSPLRIVIDGLCSGGHQLDIYKNKLYLLNTYKNAVTEICLRTEMLSAHYPHGTLEKGRSSDNYNHFNSINLTQEGFCLFAHNETNKTQRVSEIWYLDKKFQCVNVARVPAKNGHNIVHFFGEPLYCDSLAGALKLGNRAVFQCDKFTRGLSVRKDYIIVGGSDYGNRNERNLLGGWLFFLSAVDFKVLFKYPIPGMVQEVRSLDKQDYAMMERQSPVSE